MPTDLAQRHPDVRQFLATILLGGGTFDDELAGYVEGVSSPDVVRSTIAGLRELLARPDVGDDDLDEFVLDNAQRYVGSGRGTLEHIADRLQHLLDHPPPPHPLTVRAPALAAFLEAHTRSYGDLDDLVRAGAAAAPDDAAAAAQDGAALLDDPALTEADLARFVRAHSWWLLDDSGRRTVEQVVGVIRHPVPVAALGHDEARALAEALLDRDVRPGHADDVVIVDEHTQESATTWAFVYNSRTYVESGSVLDMIVGNAPVLVDKSTGRTRIGRSDLSVAEQI
jgi:hypothetical protein